MMKTVGQKKNMKTDVLYKVRPVVDIMNRLKGVYNPPVIWQ
jgi:hypothetical protein